MAHLLPNPWVLLGIVLLWIASGGWAYWQGVSDGETREIAKQSKIEEVTKAVQEAAQQGAADAIAKIEIKHTTVKQKFAAETVTHLMYRDCVHSPAGLRLVNEAITGKPDPTTAGTVRGALPADRSIFRSNQR